MSEFLSILILTRNEEIHISRCLESAFRLTKLVYVLDSNSIDKTPEIAVNLGAILISGEFNSFSDKLNWGLENIEFKTPWVMRLDADEVLSEGLIAQVPELLRTLDLDVVGIYVKRQLWFMGRWMRFGGMYPTYSMRLWRPDAVFCESRDLDEQIILRRGRHVILQVDIMDIPLTDLTSWINKHNNYATLEAHSVLRAQQSNANEGYFMSLFGTLPQRVRWIKTHIFYRLPLFVRPALYFIYRYFLRFGFLDGRVGFIFHFMHGFWYRFLIDAKINEARLKFTKKIPDSSG